MGVADLHERDGVSLFMALVPEARRDWPQSGDLEKIEIARAMSEVFPFSTREELAENLDRLVKQFPSLAPARDDKLDAWDKTMTNATRRWRLRRHQGNDPPG